ncbi:MAG: helix-turn-helix transcriptional regulator [Candidatus Omnitrophica bacterium]|nr:helix-turn-helix transcriptional regulator [Candidatus Omnitrophota bacterium]
MSIQKLIILGILKQGPKHGYEIKKIIKKELEVFASLENKSIYYPLKTMEEGGLIKKKKVSKECGKIERHVYSLTSLGDKEFLKLAMATLLSQKRPFIDIDIPLYFLPYLEKKKVFVHLRVKKKFLEKVRKWLTDNLKRKDEFSPHQKLLLKHHLNLLNAEEGFVNEVMKIVKN